MCMTIAQLLPYRDCDFTSIYRAALREGEYIFSKFSFLCLLSFIRHGTKCSYSDLFKFFTKIYSINTVYLIDFTAIKCTQYF